MEGSYSGVWADLEQGLRRRKPDLARRAIRLSFRLDQEGYGGRKALKTHGTPKEMLDQYTDNTQIALVEDLYSLTAAIEAAGDQLTEEEIDML
eukprot:7578353-Prorocentrum_lima.AAC.1